MYIYKHICLFIHTCIYTCIYTSTYGHVHMFSSKQRRLSDEILVCTPRCAKATSIHANENFVYAKETIIYAKVTFIHANINTMYASVLVCTCILCVHHHTRKKNILSHFTFPKRST